MQLSLLCATATEAHTPQSPCSSTREATAVRSQSTQLESIPSLPHQKKDCAQQGRPSMATIKNKKRIPWKMWGKQPIFYQEKSFSADGFSAMMSRLSWAFFYFLNFYLFIYLGYSGSLLLQGLFSSWGERTNLYLQCTGFLLWWPLLRWSMGSRAPGLQ